MGFPLHKPYIHFRYLKCLVIIPKDIPNHWQEKKYDNDLSILDDKIRIKSNKHCIVPHISQWPKDSVILVKTINFGFPKNLTQSSSVFSHKSIPLPHIDIMDHGLDMIKFDSPIFKSES